MLDCSLSARSALALALSGNSASALDKKKRPGGALVMGVETFTGSSPFSSDLAGKFAAFVAAATRRSGL